MYKIALAALALVAAIVENRENIKKKIESN